jgi:ferredoxin
MVSRRTHRATGVLYAVLFHIRPAESFAAASIRRQRDVYCYHASVSDIPNDRTEDDLSVLLDQILAVAIDASKQAGAIILGNAGGADVTQRKASSRDLLTLIDPLCEQVRRRPKEYCGVGCVCHVCHVVVGKGTKHDWTAPLAGLDKILADYSSDGTSDLSPSRLSGRGASGARKRGECRGAFGQARVGH